MKAPTVHVADRQRAAKVEPRVIPFSQLKTYGISWGRSHLRKLIMRGEFPAAIAISANRPVWRVADIDKWLEGRPTKMPTGVVRPPKGKTAKKKAA